MPLNLGNTQANQNDHSDITLELAPYDIMQDKQEMKKTLVNSKEIDDIVSTICVSDMNTIVLFGAQAAENISKASDVVLNSMKLSQIDQSSQLLVALNNIMKRFDINEIKDESGILGKILGYAKKRLEKTINKYHTMGEEIDKVYVELKKYESEIKFADKNLQLMFETNVGYFRELEKYILAGEQGIFELEEYISQKRAEFEKSSDSSIQIEILSLEQSKMLLEQRTHDLKIAENVALQSVPMIKTMQVSNMNLVRKINSAFIITLPIFKQALSQAILLKRQKIQAEAMSILDEKTNELLLKNAKNTVEQSKMTMQLVNSNSIKIETLETTWQVICNGIAETQQIQANANDQRMTDQKRLDEIKKDFNAKFASKY